MVRVIVNRCSVAQDDYGDWWLEFYVDDIRHAVLVSDVAAQPSVQSDVCPRCGGSGQDGTDDARYQCIVCAGTGKRR